MSSVVFQLRPSLPPSPATTTTTLLLLLSTPHSKTTKSSHLLCFFLNIKYPQPRFTPDTKNQPTQQILVQQKKIPLHCDRGDSLKDGGDGGFDRRKKEATEPRPLARWTTMTGLNLWVFGRASVVQRIGHGQ